MVVISHDDDEVMRFGFLSADHCHFTRLLPESVQYFELGERERRRRRVLLQREPKLTFGYGMDAAEASRSQKPLFFAYFRMRVLFSDDDNLSKDFSGLTVHAAAYLTSTPRKRTREPQEGSFLGYCRHKDGSLIGQWIRADRRRDKIRQELMRKDVSAVAYQVRRLVLRNGDLLYCIWIFRETSLGELPAAPETTPNADVFDIRVRLVHSLLPGCCEWLEKFPLAKKADEKAASFRRTRCKNKKMRVRVSCR